MDEPANPRVFDCMASVEYGGTLICQLMDLGVAYVETPESERPQSPLLAKIAKRCGRALTWPAPDAPAVLPTESEAA